jgi:predicted nucleotidyltransferase
MVNHQIPEAVIDELPRRLSESFGGSFKALVLYGSWARGAAREDSDVDLLAVFEYPDKDTRRRVDDLVNELRSGEMITVVCAGLEEFSKEDIPLYTAVKREGKVLWGYVDVTLSPEAPEVKYAEFFRKSREFEAGKIETAEFLASKGLGSGIADYCFVAAKHAIQAALAMQGEGYSSKVNILLPLAKKRFGGEIAGAFEALFRLNVKAEYVLEPLSEDEARSAIALAKRVLSVYGNTAGPR